MRPSPLSFAFYCLVFAITATAGPLTIADMNGTWKSKNGNEFRIWALGQDLLRVEFSGIWRHDSPQGPTANTGEGHGVASVEGDTARFKPNGAEEECAIVLKFSRGKLVVTQTGICGFGFNVTAEGDYQRTSSKEPDFETGEGD